MHIKISQILSGSGTWYTDPNTICGMAMVIAGGGSGSSVAANGTIIKGANGGSSTFDLGIAYGGNAGAEIGAQGAGGITNGSFDAWFDGGNGSGDGDRAGCAGGTNFTGSCSGSTWQCNADQGPDGSGCGGAGAPAPAGISQGGTGGGAGAVGFISFLNGGHGFSVGSGGAFADPGVGGYKGAKGANGKIVVFELVGP